MRATGEVKEESMYLEMSIYGFAVDSIANRPVVILRDCGETVTIPLWLSTAEALSMVAELLADDNGKRNSHKDLLTLLMEASGTEIAAIVIEGFRDGLFSAIVRFVQKGTELSVEVPVTEAIITALRYKMCVLVSQEVAEQASLVGLGGDENGRESNARRFTEFLDRLDPATLGKYPM